MYTEIEGMLHTMPMRRGAEKPTMTIQSAEGDALSPQQSTITQSINALHKMLNSFKLPDPDGLISTKKTRNASAMQQRRGIYIIAV